MELVWGGDGEENQEFGYIEYVLNTQVEVERHISLEFRREVEVTAINMRVVS